MKFILVLLLTLNTSYLFAEDEVYENYDSIVRRLSIQAPSQSQKNIQDLPVEMSFGYVHSTSLLRSAQSDVNRISMQGLQASMGMNLFDKFSTTAQLVYLSPQTRNTTEVDGLEFNIMGNYLPEFTNSFSGRFGAGLGVRNMNLESSVGSFKFNNPIAIISAGLEAKVSPQIGFLTTISYKNALTNQNPEKSAIDLGLSIGGHF